MSNGQLITLPMAAERNNNIAQVFKDMSKRLLSFIKQRVNGNEDAEDILQDVFYQFAGSSEPIEKASNWLYTVARNKITDKYRKKSMPLADDIFGAGGDDDESFDWKEMLLPAVGADPETEYLRSLFWDELQIALNELPAEQRDAFIQNELEDVPFKEISAATGVSVATLLSRKRYAVLHLRNRLQILRKELLDF